jgi:hypothetical protein
LTETSLQSLDLRVKDAPEGEAGSVTLNGTLRRLRTLLQLHGVKVGPPGMGNLGVSTFTRVSATGRTFAYKQMHMIRVVEGKGTEHWAVRDDAAHTRQLGGEQA